MDVRWLEIYFTMKWKPELKRHECGTHHAECKVVQTTETMFIIHSSHIHINRVIALLQDRRAVPIRVITCNVIAGKHLKNIVDSTISWKK